MPPQPGSPDDLIAAIAQAGSQTAQGWMRLFEGAQAAGNPAAWLAANAGGDARVAALQAAHVEQQARLWNAFLSGKPFAPLAEPDPADRRFAAQEWKTHPYYDYVKQSYLLNARFLGELADAVELQGQAKDRLRFAVRQWIDATCPANFAATNPEAIRKALETRGESFTRGLANLIADAGKGRLSQSDEASFEVGRNLATAPGHVIYENELIQLIQYSPASARVGKRPLVMVPPCINKYYILDLQPGNSFVRYAVGMGHTVFMVSWRNVGPELGHLAWDDYLEKGVFTAFRVAREIARSDRVNALGFCVGGTLLGAGLAVLAAKGDDLVASATYLATMLDFSETGQLGLFVDEPSVAAREAAIGRGGVLPGSDLAFVFSALRANDLIWPYVVNNYLMGGSPAAFDLLYWNADSTNLPGPMYCYYLRNTYLENRLRVPDALDNCGVKVDLGGAACPSFILATREDHIVPWRSAYRSVALLGGEKTFVLGASGHVAGVINPADKNRRSYWIDAGVKGALPPRPPGDAGVRSALPPRPLYPDDPDAWLAGASEHPGSWWPRWAQWLAAHKGGERKAPAKPGSRKYRPIERAPGRYVKERAPAVMPAAQGSRGS